MKVKDSDILDRLSDLELDPEVMAEVEMALDVGEEEDPMAEEEPMLDDMLAEDAPAEEPADDFDALMAEDMGDETDDEDEEDIVIPVPMGAKDKKKPIV